VKNKNGFYMIVILLIAIIIAISLAAFKNPVLWGKKCVTGGCSGQLCGEESAMKGIYTTCEFRPEYACYQEFNKCELQATGECGWTQTSELLGCLGKK